MFTERSCAINVHRKKLDGKDKPIYSQAHMGAVLGHWRS